MALLTLVLVNLIFVIAILLVGKSEPKQGRWLEHVKVGDMPTAPKRQILSEKKLSGIIGGHSEAGSVKQRLERLEKLIEKLLTEHEDLKKELARLRTQRAG